MRVKIKVFRQLALSRAETMEWAEQPHIKNWLWATCIAKEGEFAPTAAELEQLHRWIFFYFDPTKERRVRRSLGAEDEEEGAGE
jgi:hypothetical protein